MLDLKFAWLMLCKLQLRLCLLHKRDKHQSRELSLQVLACRRRARDGYLFRVPAMHHSRFASMTPNIPPVGITRSTS